MGCSTSHIQTPVIRAPEYNVALKLIHGVKCIVYDHRQKDFVVKDDIHTWIYDCFRGKTIKHYINYNDEHKDKVSSSGGHCKGCIAWNDTEVYWLVHSVPKFMVHFDNDGQINIPDTVIAASEQIYGQSFVFATVFSLDGILSHVAAMHPFVDLNTSNAELPKVDTMILSAVSLSSVLEHIAKPPSVHIDIFSEYIQLRYGGIWRCETWRRGHYCPERNEVIDNSTVRVKNEIVYSSSHDHSKYACNDKDKVYIGDLNRMTTQYHRGGGGFIITDAGLAAAIRELFR